MLKGSGQMSARGSGQLSPTRTEHYWRQLDSSDEGWMTGMGTHKPFSQRSSKVFAYRVGFLIATSNIRHLLHEGGLATSLQANGGQTDHGQNVPTSH